MTRGYTPPRLTALTVTRPTPVRVLGADARFAQNDEPEQPAKWSNWTVLDASGRALWIVYATDEQHALQQYGQPIAVSARPESPEDRALSRKVYGSWGRLD